MYFCGAEIEQVLAPVLAAIVGRGTAFEFKHKLLV